ncbi:MAG: DUF6056 family protein [Bacilli bacterium]|nr:DUF6056 family protein [Bacilli bacterium]
MKNLNNKSVFWELINQNKGKIICYTLIVILFFVLALLFPYTRDDWTWGSHIGINRLNDLFKNYNGRYFGNLVVILLTRSNILKSICMSLVLFGIIYLSSKIVNKTKNFFLISTMLILATPKDIFSQSIAWTSGFSNYAISIFLTLCYIYLIRDIFNEYKPDKLKYSFLLYFVLGFSSALFIEHLTIYNLILSILVIIYSFIKYRKVAFSKLLYFLGAALGAFTMFSNEAYQSIAHNDDFYRIVAMSFLDVLKRVYNNYFGVIYKELIFSNFIINIIITSLLLILVYNFFAKEKKVSKQKRNVILVSININLIFIIYCLFKVLNPSWNILLKYTDFFEGVFTIIYAISILLIVIFTVSNKNKKQKLIFYLLSIVVMTLPLLLVTPIWARNFMSTYVIFIIFIIEIIDYLFKDKAQTFIIKISALISLVLIVFLFSIYGYIYIINEERNYYILHQSKVTKNIDIPILPYSNYLWRSTPDSKHWQSRYKYYYNIEQEVEFNPIPYKEWFAHKDQIES